MILDMADWTNPSTFNLFIINLLYQFLMEHLCYLKNRRVIPHVTVDFIKSKENVCINCAL